MAQVLFEFVLTKSAHQTKRAAAMENFVFMFNSANESPADFWETVVSQAEWAESEEGKYTNGSAYMWTNDEGTFMGETDGEALAQLDGDLVVGQNSKWKETESGDVFTFLLAPTKFTTDEGDGWDDPERFPGFEANFRVWKASEWVLGDFVNGKPHFSNTTEGYLTEGHIWYGVDGWKIGLEAGNEEEIGEKVLGTAKRGSLAEFDGDGGVWFLHPAPDSENRAEIQLSLQFKKCTE